MRAPKQKGAPLPSWLRPVSQRLSPIVRALIIASTLMFLLYVFAPPLRVFVHEYLALGPGFLRGMLWQPLTALLVHIDPLSFFFDMIGLWFIGAGLEHSLGRRRFSLVFFVPAVAGGIAQVLVSALIGHGEMSAGSGLGVLGLFVAFGVFYGRTQVRLLGGLDVEARVLAAVLVAFSVVVQLLHGALAALVGTLVAVVIAFFLAGGRGRDLLGVIPRKAGKRGRARYTVLDGGKRGRDDDDRYVN